MFECKYKMEEIDCVIGARYVYRSQKRKQDKVVAILLPILMVCMLAMLIYDIAKHKSIVWDVVLFVALIVLELCYILIPQIVIRSAKKSYRQMNYAEMDYLYVKIENDLCVQTLFKDNQEKAKSIHNLKRLTSYIEDSERMILIFNNVEYICLRKENITGGVEKLKQHLEKAMSKSMNNKK